MKINLEKILSHAQAELRVLPQGGDQDWTRLFKKFLHVENHRLLMAHRYGAEGLTLIQNRSHLMDILVRHIFELAQREYAIQHERPPVKMALIALGGYGRQTLNPCSDIDILFLAKQSLQTPEDQILKRILYLLWDIGLKVGQAVRTIPQTIEEGNRDFKSRTAMMEARFITGDESLFEEFQKLFSKKCSSLRIADYVAFKLEEIKTRHQKYQGTVYLQEPHVKEGVGGLRDIASILWLYQALKGYRSFEELLEHRLISEKEFKIIQKSLNFLHRVRNELHFLSGKCFDILSVPLQPKVARNLGYRDTPILKMSESFMKDYYLHVRNIHQITQMFLSRDEIQTQLKIPFPQKFVQRHGFSFTAEEIFPGENPNLFRENPAKLFEVFLYCAQGNDSLSQSLIQQIREHLFLVNKKIQSSSEILNHFVSLMSYESPISKALRAMHDTGLLGKYIPEFGKATCFVQHDFYHKYTLDEHTLKVIEFLDELKTTQDPRQQGFSKLFKEIQERDVLFLSALFHDIAKTQGHNHAVNGAKMVQVIFERMPYDPMKAERVRLLVEQHLVMSHLSQRRDLSEEKVIIDFSQKVVDVENLKMLQLLTFADWRATSEDVWTEWREALLWELFYKTKRYLEEKVILLPSEIDAMKESHLEILTQKGFSRETLINHLETLPVHYLQAYRSETIAEHIKMIEALQNQDPQIHWDYHEKTNVTDLTICTRDHLGLFSEMAGVIASQEVNILSAHIFTRKDGFILDKFSLENRYEKGMLDERTRQKVEEGMRKVLKRTVTVESFLRAHTSQKMTAKKAQALIKFDNETSLATTVVEIQTDDEVGFLYKVTRTFSKLGLNIHLAKIATEKAQILDVFYITDFDGKKIDHPKVQKAIQEELQKAIQSPLEEI
ncbi:MAG: [protein-PII] uridylyltransferase [Chlamydiae bacterium]|nr:[protein-PII] uridylyltransferase [Chlamydiota bacterium]MBI3266197.1 [protein-PII] uridylyltransferase [Chlamydiota bacterium]